MPRAGAPTPVEPPRAAGLYVVCAPAGATPSAANTREITFVHEEGEELEVLEQRRLPDGRWRGLGPQGWVSFISEQGARLLQPVEPCATIFHAGEQASGGTVLPSCRKWARFFESAGVADYATVDIPTARRAVRELSLGLERTRELVAAHKAVVLEADGTVSRRELQNIFVHHHFFVQRWTELQALRRVHGGALNLPQLHACCRTLGERFGRADARRAHAQLIQAKQNHTQPHTDRQFTAPADEVPFDDFCVWLARFVAGLPPLAPGQQSLGWPSDSQISARRRAHSPTATSRMLGTDSRSRSRSRSKSPYARAHTFLSGGVDQQRRQSPTVEELRHDAILRRFEECTADELAEAWRRLSTDARGRYAPHLHHRITSDDGGEDTEGRGESPGCSSDDDLFAGQHSQRRRHRYRRHRHDRHHQAGSPLTQQVAGLHYAGQSAGSGYQSDDSISLLTYKGRGRGYHGDGESSDSWSEISDDGASTFGYDPDQLFDSDDGTMSDISSSSGSSLKGRRRRGRSSRNRGRSSPRRQQSSAINAAFESDSRTVTRWRPAAYVAGIADGDTLQEEDYRVDTWEREEKRRERNAMARCIGMVLRHGDAFEAKLRAYAEISRQPELAFLLISNQQQNRHLSQSIAVAGKSYRRRLQRSQSKGLPTSLEGYVRTMALMRPKLAIQAFRAQGVYSLDDWNRLVTFDVSTAAASPSAQYPTFAATECERLLRAMRDRSSPEQDCRTVRGHVFGTLDGFEQTNLQSTVAHQAHVHDDISSSSSWAGGGPKSSRHSSYSSKADSRKHQSIISHCHQSHHYHSSTLLPPDGRLFVKILDCADLLPADKDQLSDPRVELTLGHNVRKQSAKTMVVKKNLNPQFNDSFEFPIIGAKQPGDCELTLTVWDEDMIVRGTGMKRDFIGKCVVDLCSEFSGQWTSRTVNRSFALSDPQGKVKDSNATAELARRSGHQHGNYWRSNRPGGQYGFIRIEASFVGVEMTDGVAAHSMNVTGTWHVIGTEQQKLAAGKGQTKTINSNSWLILEQYGDTVSGRAAEGDDVLERRAGTQRAFTVRNGRVEGHRISFDQMFVISGEERVTHWFAKLDLKAGMLHMTDGQWSGAVVGSFEASLSSASVPNGINSPATTQDPGREVSWDDTYSVISHHGEREGEARYPAMQEGTLRVTIISCEDLVPADRKLAGEYSSSDPYVKLTLTAERQTDQVAKTQVIPKSLSPRFTNEVKDFWIGGVSTRDQAPADHRLHVEVFDSDKIGSDDFLGERSIDLATMFNDAEWTQSHSGQWNLRDPHKRVKPEHRDAKLKQYRKRGLGLVELKVDFFPGLRPPRQSADGSTSGAGANRSAGSPSPRASSFARARNRLSSGDLYRPDTDAAKLQRQSELVRNASAISRQRRN